MASVALTQLPLATNCRWLHWSSWRGEKKDAANRASSLWIFNIPGASRDATIISGMLRDLQTTHLVELIFCCSIILMENGCLEYTGSYTMRIFQPKQDGLDNTEKRTVPIQ